MRLCNRAVTTALYFLLFAGVTAPPVPAHRISIQGGARAACAVVTREDVQEALGRAVGAGEEQLGAGESTCDYASGRGQVTITVQRIKAKMDLVREMASLEASIPNARVRETPGLGAPAFSLDIAGAGTQLFVVRGEDVFVMVSVLGFGDAPQVAPAAVRLARKALARI